MALLGVTGLSASLMVASGSLGPVIIQPSPSPQLAAPAPSTQPTLGASSIPDPRPVPEAQPSDGPRPSDPPVPTPGPSAPPGGPQGDGLPAVPRPSPGPVLVVPSDQVTDPPRPEPSPGPTPRPTPDPGDTSPGPTPTPGPTPRPDPTPTPGPSPTPRPTPTTPGPPPTPTPTPELVRWAPCDSGGLECATLDVPVDHAAPSGTTPIGLRKRPADNPASRIGTLVVVPGGSLAPTDSIESYAALLGPQVRERFDILAVDPRGTGRSGGAICSAGVASARFAPVTDDEVDARRAADDAIRIGCAASASPLLRHLSTADTARDLDAVRAALRQEALSVVARSRGTYLAQTYAALFPTRVRALALDGVVDPQTWATGRDPVTVRAGMPQAADGALQALLADCSRLGVALCPAGPGLASEWAALQRTLDRGPITAGGREVTAAEVDTTVVTLLSDSRRHRALVDTIHAWYLGSRGRAHSVPPLPASGNDLVWDGSVGTTQQRIALAATMCTDTDNPSDPAARSAAIRRLSSAPGVAVPWVWQSSLCAGWPATSPGRYTGDFTSAVPALVVNLKDDPVTPIQGARAASRNLVGSRLLTVDGVGHDALGRGTCVSAAYTAYLVGGTLPPNGARCTVDRPSLP